jgi:hypothetical protein
MPSGRKLDGDAPLSNADRRSRQQRWHDAVTELLALQTSYAAWLEALPDTLQGTATADALQAIVDLDLDALAAIELPPVMAATDDDTGRSHGSFIMLGTGDGLKGCASRTDTRRLRPLTPSPVPSSRLTCRVALLLSAAEGVLFLLCAPGQTAA